MSQRHVVQDASGIITSIPGKGIVHVAGGWVANGSAGYAPGCILQYLDGPEFYVNEGTLASCLFNLIPTDVYYASTDGAASIGLADSGSFTTTTTVEAALAELYQHLFSATGGFIPLPLTSFREIDGSGDVPNAAGVGGVLASDTTPILRGDDNEALEIAWVATDVDPIAIAVPLPSDFDGTANATISLFVRSDTTDTSSFTVNTTWDGGTQIVDTATGSASAALHTATATIAAADIPNAPSTLTIQLVPGAHGTDAFLLLGARLNYKRKLLTS